MKRVILLSLILSLLLTVCGCNNEQNTEFLEPVSFYYYNDLDSKTDFTSIFVSETREGKQYIGDMTGLLNLYISGPQSENLKNPFPKNLSVISTEITTDTVRIHFNEHLASQTGLRLTLITTCIGLTVFDITNCENIIFTTENGKIDEQDELLITKDLLIFTDDYLPPTEE